MIAGPGRRSGNRIEVAGFAHAQGVDAIVSVDQTVKGIWIVDEITGR
jgi:hypothetical protein